VDAIGQRALTHDSELRRRGQRAADKRTEGEDERSFWREWIERRGAFAQQNPDAEAATAEVLAQDRVGEGHTLGAAGRDVDAKETAVIAERHTASLRQPATGNRQPEGTRQKAEGR